MSAFPPKDGAVAALRASCAALRTASGIVLAKDKMDAVLLGLDQGKFQRLSQTHGIAFPLQFDSVAEEINFLAVLALLNGLSGYRAEFHAATGSGVYDNILRLLVGLYLDAAAADGTSRLSAQGLASITAQDVSGIWGISLMQEKPHSSLPGITVGERSSPMCEPVDLLVATCNETGTQLLSQGFEDLGAYVLYALRTGDEARSSAIARVKKAGQDDQAHYQGDIAGLDATVSALFSLSGFADRAEVQGQEVALGKKIFFLLYTLTTKFEARSDFPIHLPPTRLLPMFVDNVIPTMLHQMGVVNLSGASAGVLRMWMPYVDSPGADGKKVQPGPGVSTQDGYRVRAASLEAGSMMVARAHMLAKQFPTHAWMASMTEAELDGYLWSVAKDDPALRRVPRLSQRGTMMF